MANNDYIMYLNSLHNYNAQNQNAYGEKNVTSPFFNDVMVKVGLCNFIYERLNGNQPHIIILTGHAGDGKTSIMYQVLNDLGLDFNVNEKISDTDLPSGKKCRCIKDFSELADEEKTSILSEVMSFPEQDKFVFMVANTGPLINTFGELFENENEKERAKIKLIDAMDNNTGSINDIMGKKITVINVATVDNTYFATEFLDKLLQDKLWIKCEQCNKKEYCHIYQNKNLILKNRKQVFDFVNMHYIWLTEHGKRLTIRSMTEQLAYMITGGMNCDEVVHEESYKYLFSNLFFGYIGTKENNKALSILAVREAQKCMYDNKRLRSDELLLVNREYGELFGKEIKEILKNAEVKNAYVMGWAEFLRRTYIFMNIVTDEQVIEGDYEDIFSKQFTRFLALRNGNTTPAKSDTNLICDALSMIYIGTTNNDQQIPLTLSRESGIAQNVQLITGTLSTRYIKVIQEQTKDSMFIKERERYVLKLEVNKNVLDCELSLPLLDYFEELKNGVISTNIDPQLSHGVESLKAELSKEMDDTEDESFEMIILRNNGNKPVCLEITDKNRIREV
ncbi:MAG: hypothetical protein RR681_03280 [Lachnospiraceae bacterium]